MNTYLVLVLLLVPLGEIFSVYFFGVRIRFLDFMIGIGLIYAFFHSRRRIPQTLSALRHSALTPMIVLVLLHAVVMLFIQDSVASMYAIRTFAYLVWGFFVLDFEESNLSDFARGPNPYRAITISFIIVMFLGLIQLVLYPSLRPLLYLGYDPHLGRLAAPFMDPNVTGMVLALFFTYFLAYTNKSKLAKIVLLFLSLAAIMLTYSRISYVTTFAVSVFFLILSKNAARFAIVLIVLMIALVFILLPREDSIGTRLLRVNSIIAKKESIDSTYRLTVLSRGVGIGFNRLYRVNAAHTQKGIINNSAFALDNSYLTVIATMGIFGLLAYFFFFYKRFLIPHTASKLLLLVLFVGSASVNLFFIPSFFVLWVLLSHFSLASYRSPDTLSASHSRQRRKRKPQ